MVVVVVVVVVQGCSGVADMICSHVLRIWLAGVGSAVEVVAVVSESCWGG